MPIIISFPWMIQTCLASCKTIISGYCFQEWALEMIAPVILLHFRSVFHFNALFILGEALLP